MSGTKHTPGPWCVRVSQAVLIGKEDDYADYQNFMAIAVMSRHSLINNKEAIANAHLAAAAPDMAEALEPFAEIDGEGDEDFPDDAKVTLTFGRTTDCTLTLGDLRRARSALARARGAA